MAHRAHSANLNPVLFYCVQANHFDHLLEAAHHRWSMGRNQTGLSSLILVVQVSWAIVLQEDMPRTHSSPLGLQTGSIRCPNVVQNFCAVNKSGQPLESAAWFGERVTVSCKITSFVQ